jgi:hypothetical protein
MPANYFPTMLSTERLALTNVTTGAEVAESDTKKTFVKTATGWAEIIPQTYIALGGLMSVDLPNNAKVINTFQTSDTHYANWGTPTLTDGQIFFPSSGLYKIFADVSFLTSATFPSNMNFVYSLGVNLYNDDDFVKTQTIGSTINRIRNTNGNVGGNLHGELILSINKTGGIPINSMRFWQSQYNPGGSSGYTGNQQPPTFLVQKISELRP